MNENPSIRRPAILIMELANGGNLRKFLHDSRYKAFKNSSQNFYIDCSMRSIYILNVRFNFLSHKKLSTLSDTKAKGLEIRDLLSFGYQAARGMEHLESKNVGN